VSQGGYEEYHLHSCTGEADENETAFKYLLISLSDAFDSGALNRSIGLDGAIGFFKKYQCGPACKLCRRILKSFPLQSLTLAFGAAQGYERSDFCIAEEEVFSIISQRHWSIADVESVERETLSSANSRILFLNAINIEGTSLQSEYANSETKDAAYLYYFSERKLKRLAFLQELGCRPRPFDRGQDDLTKKEIMMTELHDEYPQGGYMITKRTFDALKDIGYPVSEHDFVIVDDPAFLKILMLDAQNEFMMDFAGTTST